MKRRERKREEGRGKMEEARGKRKREEGRGRGKTSKP
jgi:hypothetical protein